MTRIFKSLLPFLAGILLISTWGNHAYGQVDNGQNIGLPANGAFDGSGIESVQLNNGNLHIEIPLFTVPGRGLPVKVSYVYDSKNFNYAYIGSTTSSAVVNFCQFGSLAKWPTTYCMWRIAAPLSNPTVALQAAGPIAGVHCSGGAFDEYFTETYTEPNGSSHTTDPILWQTTCADKPNLTGNLAYMTDGSGFAFENYDKITNSTHYAVFNKNGTRFYPQSVSGGIQYTLEDANGNQITRFLNTSTNTLDSTVVDTLGRRIAVALTLNSSTGKYELPYTDSNGNQQKIVVALSPTNIQTHLCPYILHSSSCSEYSSTSNPPQPNAPTEIDLPNGMKYTIGSYNSYGMPSSITLPTGATISYTYGTGSATSPNFDTDGYGPYVISRSINNNGQVSTWNYTYMSGSTNGNTSVSRSAIVTDPFGNDTVHQFQKFGLAAISTPGPNPVGYYEIETDYYSGSHSNGSLLKQVQNVVQGVQTPHLVLSTNTTWPQQSNLQTRTETDWDNIPNTVTGYKAFYTTVGWANPVETREYAFGAGAYGALARKTHFNYAHLSGNTNYNVNYANLNIADLVTEKQVYDGSNNLFSDTKDSYDGASLTTTSSVPNHDYTTGAFRGNLTQVSKWLNPSGTWISTNNAFNDLGHIISTTDPLNNVTTFSYTDSWSGAMCGVGTNTQAYLTQTTAPATATQHRFQFSYYACTGQKQSTRDENDILESRAGTSYTYDLMLRPASVTFPDGGQTDYSYNDVPNSVSTTTSELMDTSNHHLVTVSLHDGLGRVKQTQLTSDPEGTVYTDVTYDLIGRKSTVSNPASPSAPDRSCHGDQHEHHNLYDAGWRYLLLHCHEDLDECGVGWEAQLDLHTRPWTSSCYKG